MIVAKKSTLLYTQITRLKWQIETHWLSVGRASISYLLDTVDKLWKQQYNKRH